MPTMVDALNNWLQHSQNTSLLRQLTVCEMFSDETREQMIAISEDSARVEKEMGAPISKDLNLGMVITGTKYTVPLPRPGDTIGTFHTHPYGWAKPSSFDLLDALSHDDKLTCIGATGWIGTRIACYAPKQPQWFKVRNEAIKLKGEIREFNKTVGGRYRDRKLGLARLLRAVDPTSARAAESLEIRRKELMDKLETDLIHTHRWEPERSTMESCMVIWETLEEKLPEL